MKFLTFVFCSLFISPMIGQSLNGYSISSSKIYSSFGGNEINIEKTYIGHGSNYPISRVEVKINGIWYQTETGLSNRMTLCFTPDNSEELMDTTTIFEFNEKKYLDLFFVFWHNPTLIEDFRNSSKFIEIREFTYVEGSETNSSYSNILELEVPPMSEEDFLAFQLLVSKKEHFKHFYSKGNLCCTLENGQFLETLFTQFPESQLGIMAKYHYMIHLFSYSWGKAENHPMNIEIRELCNGFQDSDIEVIKANSEILCKNKMN